jgi:hypothetical protein
MKADLLPRTDPRIDRERGSFWSFEIVEERLVEAMRLWRRSPGDGRWPFAGDGPWHLVRDDGSAQAAWDHNLNALQMGRPATEKPKPLPLSRAEVAERDQASDWISRYVPERDRKLVVLGLIQLANGNSRVRWSDIRRKLGAEVQAQSLGKRYSRAITAIARGLNSADFRAVGVSRQLVNGDENKACTPTAS